MALSVASLELTSVHARPQFMDIINQANTAFRSNDISNATSLFIQGYWSFRNAFTKIWHDADTKNKRKPKWYFPDLGLNGDPITLEIGNRFENTRGYVPMSNIFLGCWLNNSLLHQRGYWYLPTSPGLPGHMIYHDDVSKSNIIKRELIKTFGDVNRFKALRDVGHWLQKDFCEPVSQLLLKLFQSTPQNAHELLQILELYKCYIECDCGGEFQIKFAQANYSKVYNAFYPWLADVIRRQLSNPADNDLHTALIAVLFHCDEKMSDFTDTRTLSHETIRGLGGYQIEIGTFLKYTMDPNSLRGVKIYEGQSAVLFNELKNVEKKWEDIQQVFRKALGNSL